MRVMRAPDDTRRGDGRRLAVATGCGGPACRAGGHFVITGSSSSRIGAGLDSDRRRQCVIESAAARESGPAGLEKLVAGTTGFDRLNAIPSRTFRHLWRARDQIHRMPQIALACDHWLG